MTAMLPPLKKAAKMGRGGDTMIAHINPMEAEMLRMMGGAGTRNPSTGLLEFRYDREDTKAAGTSGTASADRGRTSAARSGSTGGNQGGGRLYKDPDLGGLATSYGAPVHTLTQSPISSGISVAQNEGTWGNTKSQVNSYNDATRAWNKDLVLNNVLGMALPFGLQNVAPRYDQPATYTGGTYHFGMNPAAAAGGVAGMFAGPFGPLIGPAAGKIYGLADGKNLVFSGPDVPAEWRGGIDPSRQGQPVTQNQGQPMGPQDSRTSSGTGLLPPIAGNATQAAPPIPGVTPPVTQQPQQRFTPSGWMPVPGPTRYGWQRPSWSF